MLKMSMNAWKDHMTAFQTSPPALIFLVHITVYVVIVMRKTTPVCQKVLSTSCSELNCAPATSCKDIFFGICLHKSDSNLIIDWHCICWFCDNLRWIRCDTFSCNMPVPPYFSFKAVFQTTLCNNIPVLSIRLFLHWYLFCPIIEFDVWRRAIFSKN